ncbi:MAG: hypothetical protein Q8R92_07330 [Deltaproteobacteria bacterium]|nr:hypothetical protein [Deltaproteobacteria bacterium]
MPNRKRAKSIAAPTAGELVLEALERLSWASLRRAAGPVALAATTLAGLLALLMAATLLAAHVEESRRIEGLAQQATQEAGTDRQRFEMVGAFVHGAVERTRADRTADPSAWIQAPPGPLGVLATRYPAAGRLLKPFFEPPYASFLKPGALQAYFYYPDCAGASRLMIRMLAAIGIQSSKLCLYDGAGVGRHAVVEAEVDGRRAIADANHGIVYHLNDGRLATAADLARDPGVAMAHIGPEDDPVIADYRNARSMNWSKIPVIMPLAHDLLQRLIGDRVNRIPRPAFVELPKVISACAFLFLGALLLLPAAAAPTRRLLARYSGPASRPSIIPSSARVRSISSTTRA